MKYRFLSEEAVAHALLRAASRLFSTLLRPETPSVDNSVDAARKSACATWASAALALTATIASAQPAKKVTYDEDVRPILARRCFTCHGNGEARNGLSLETFAGVMKGGASGDAVQPGRPATSL